MNITNSKNLNVRTDEISKGTSARNSDTKFSEELENIQKQENLKNDAEEVKDKPAVKDGLAEKEKQAYPENIADKENLSKENFAVNDKPQIPDSAIYGLNNTIVEINKLNQKDESEKENIKKDFFNDDIKNKYEVLGLIDNNVNLQEQQDKFNVQTGTNMNFSSDGQPFSAFVNKDKSVIPGSSSKDLAEEQAIMSTMEENIAIANKNIAMSRNKIVENEHGIQKVDKKTNLVVDTIVNYDSVIMDKADVEFFANLAENRFLDVNEVTNVEKSSRVSKTLADMLVKAMNENKPVRIDFDNNISVIIKIDRAGKISADFLPSSQVAEAYLKENLPLLKQRFDDNNIDYNELNHRQRKQDTQDNRKKERKDE